MKIAQCGYMEISKTILYIFSENSKSTEDLFLKIGIQGCSKKCPRHIVGVPNYMSPRPSHNSVYLESHISITLLIGCVKFCSRVYTQIKKCQTVIRLTKKISPDILA